jgi:hypothetical protein
MSKKEARSMVGVLGFLDLEKIPAAFEKLRMSLQSNEGERSRFFHRQSSLVTAITSFSHHASAL